MKTFLKNLRQFFLIASIPAVAFFALFYFAAGEPLVNERMHFLLMTILLLLIMVGVIALHAYLKHAEKQCIDKAWDEQTHIFGKAYKIRIVCLNVMSFLSSLLYFITIDMNCVYATGMITLLVLLSYPSKQFISNGVDFEDDEDNSNNNDNN